MGLFEEFSSDEFIPMSARLIEVRNTKRKAQTQTIELMSSGSAGKGRSEDTQRNGDRRDSREEEEEERTQRKKKKEGPKSKKARTAARTLASAANIEQLRAACVGKPGCPPTIGEYVRLAEAKKAANDERERELRLEREVRTFSMAENFEILKRKAVLSIGP